MLVSGCSAYDAAKAVASCLCLSVPESDNYQQKISYQGIQQQVSRLLAQCIDGQSPYLINKGLERFSGVFSVLGNVTVSCGNIEFGAGTAVFPLYNIANQVTGAQLISPNGDKRLLAGSVMKGSYVILQNDPNLHPSQIIITEGIATGFTIADFSQNLSEKSSIFAAISANNLLPVALALRKLYPNFPIIMAGDNDDPQNESKNIGKLLAEKAALAIQGKVALPPTNYKADWDDYRREVGASQAQSDFEISQYVPSSSHNKTINHV